MNFNTLSIWAMSGIIAVSSIFVSCQDLFVTDIDIDAIVPKEDPRLFVVGFISPDGPIQIVGQRIPSITSTNPRVELITGATVSIQNATTKGQLKLAYEVGRDDTGGLGIYTANHGPADFALEDGTTYELRFEDGADVITGRTTIPESTPVDRLRIFRRVTNSLGGESGTDENGTVIERNEFDYFVDFSFEDLPGDNYYHIFIAAGPAPDAEPFDEELCGEGVSFPTPILLNITGDGADRYLLTDDGREGETISATLDIFLQGDGNFINLDENCRRKDVIYATLYSTDRAYYLYHREVTRDRSGGGPFSSTPALIPVLLDNNVAGVFGSYRVNTTIFQVADVVDF